MSLAKKFATFVAPAALAAGFTLAANDAAALDLKPGQCLPAAEMMSQLKAEGQRSVIVGDRVWVDQAAQKAGRKFNVFTSNGDGSLGYNIEGNSPMGELSTEFCLGISYTDIVLYDSKGRKVPSTIPANTPLAVTVQSGIDRGNQSPMMVANRNGAIFVISGNPEKKSTINGVLLVGNNSEKKAAILVQFTNLDYSPNVDKAKLATSNPQQSGVALALAPKN